MPFKVAERDAGATVVDAISGDAIVTIKTVENIAGGAFYHVPVFKQGMAAKVADALNLAEAVNRIVEVKPGIYLS